MSHEAIDCKAISSTVCRGSREGESTAAVAADGLAFDRQDRRFAKSMFPPFHPFSFHLGRSVTTNSEFVYK